MSALRKISKSNRSKTLVKVNQLHNISLVKSNIWEVMFKFTALVFITRSTHTPTHKGEPRRHQEWAQTSTTKAPEVICALNLNSFRFFSSAQHPPKQKISQSQSGGYGYDDRRTRTHPICTLFTCNLSAWGRPLWNDRLFLEPEKLLTNHFCVFLGFRTLATCPNKNLKLIPNHSPKLEHGHLFLVTSARIRTIHRVSPIHPLFFKLLILWDIKLG